MKYFIIQSLFAFASAQKAYSAELKCGSCISSGFNFCVQGTDGQVFEEGVRPVATCCQDGACAEATDATYTCSSTYSDIDYALTFCPQPKKKCGEKHEIEYSETGAESVTVTNLTVGETCTYKVKSNCGSPAFKANGTKNVNITYIEFESTQANKTSGGKGKNKSPKEGMPTRNMTFADSGDQGQYQGQKKPPKKNKNGTVEDGEYMDGLNEFGESSEGENKRQGGGNKGGSMNSTRGGYGKPTKGEYNTTQGGFKTFGSEGQGEVRSGLKGENSNVCS